MSDWWVMKRWLCGAGVAALFTALVGGCGSSDRGSVTGVVTRKDGTPLAGTQVSARSDTGKSASGQTDAQGAYKLASRDGDGVPAGDYSVIIAEDLGGMSSFRKPTIDGKYANGSTSGLKFSVKPGENVVFDIKLDPSGAAGSQ